MTRLSRNIASLFSADMARRALGFVAVVYLARVLGKDGFGFINIAFAVLAYGVVLSAAGFPTLGTKRIAQGDSSEFIGNIFGARLLTTAGVFVVTIISALTFLHDAVHVLVIAIFALGLFAQTFFLDWYFQGRERMNIVSIGRVLSSSIYTLIVITMVRTINDVWIVACAAVAGDIGAAWYYIWRFKKEHRPKIHIVFSVRMFKESFLLSLGIILSTLVINFPPFVLSALQSNAEVGIFSAASKIVFFFLVGDRLLLPLLLPASARRQTDSPEALSHLLSEALRWIFIFGLPMAVGGMIVAERIILLVFGAAYIASAEVFRIFIWYFFFTMLHSIYVSGLIAAGREKLYGKLMLITAALYVLTVMLGSWRFGAIGAAFGIVLSEAISVVMMRSALTSVLSIPSPRAVLRIVAATIVMGFGIVFLSDGNFLLSILLGIIIYAVMIFATRGMTWNEAKTFLARFA